MADDLNTLKTQTELEAVARRYVERVVLAPLHSEEWQALQHAAHELGLPEQRALARSSSPRLSILPQERLEAMTPHLTALRQILEDLSPPAQRRTWRNLWQAPPRRRRMSMPEANARLNQILHALYAHQDALRRDNAVLEQAAAALREQQEQTQQALALASRIEQALSSGLSALERHEPLRAQEVREGILYALHSRTTDLLTQLSVAKQAELAMGLIRRNNEALLHNITRASTTTVSALKVTLLLSQTLQAQARVSQEVKALEEAARRTNPEELAQLPELLATLSEISRAHAEAQASAEAAAQQLQQLQGQ